MANQPPEIIAKYDVLFALRTGVTILVPEVKAFSGNAESKIFFRISPDNPNDLLIDANGKKVILKDLKKDYLDEALERGFVMFYEMKDEEVIRCTPCNFQK
jgi:hypothetical protein